MIDKFNIAIVGHGYVGQAVEHGFNTAQVNITIIDPKYGTTVLDLKGSSQDLIFICVPTPSTNLGSIDSSIIESVYADIVITELRCPVVVKSTVTPDVILKLAEVYPKTLYNPEFLTERSAVEDFLKPNLLVVGGADDDECQWLVSVYKEYSCCSPCPVVIVDLPAASMFKYTINTFLAANVVMFNQLYNVYNQSGTNTSWPKFVNAVSLDSRIGVSHMQVPGHDGQYGFGGSCFPKDAAALAYYAQSIDNPITLLDEAICANRSLRVRMPPANLSNKY
jgi:UDPglucose 6-dehydrogenase